MPRLVNRCQGNCGNNLFPADKDYLVMKSRGRISFMNKPGEMDSKYCPLYIHFKAECLQEYAWCIHDVHYKAFLFSEITFGKDKLTILSEEVKVFLEETGMDVSNNHESSFLHDVLIVCRFFYGLYI